MTDHNIDEIGPVDYLVIAFPAGQQNFTGEVAQEIVKLVEAGTIRLIEALVIGKEADGSVDAVDIADLGDLGPLVALEAHLAGLLAADDLVSIAAAIQPGDAVGVIVYENVWAAGFGAAARRAGGQLVGAGRIPTQAIIAALEAGEH